MRSAPRPLASQAGSLSSGLDCACSAARRSRRSTIGRREQSWSSYIAGVVFFSGTFYWITETMVTYGGLSSPLAVGVGALFALSYALYFVLFALAVHFVIKKFGTAGLLFSAPLWVTMEWLRAVLFSGFPWMLSGYALVPYAGILQLVVWTGVYRPVVSGDAGEQPRRLLHITAQ